MSMGFLTPRYMGRINRTIEANHDDYNKNVRASRSFDRSLAVVKERLGFVSTQMKPYHTIYSSCMFKLLERLCRASSFKLLYRPVAICSLESVEPPLSSFPCYPTIDDVLS